MMSRTVRVLSAMFLFTCLLAAPAFAETISQTFDHALGNGNNPQSWEHRIDLPDAWAMNKVSFVGRSVELKDKLVIEREELKPNYYYIKVRLPKGWWGSAKGSVRVTVEGSAVPLTAPVLGACTALKATDPGDMPNLSWNGAGKFTNVTLIDRASGRTIWERVILGATSCKMDESYLTVGHNYFFGTRQSDGTGRYSPESKIAFKIGTRKVPCTTCGQSGWVRCPFCNGTGMGHGGPIGSPNSFCSNCHGTGRVVCNTCNGSGKMDEPIIVNE